MPHARSSCMSAPAGQVIPQLGGSDPLAAQVIQDAHCTSSVDLVVHGERADLITLIECSLNRVLAHHTKVIISHIEQAKSQSETTVGHLSEKATLPLPCKCPDAILPEQSRESQRAAKLQSDGDQKVTVDATVPGDGVTIKTFVDRLEALAMRMEEANIDDAVQTSSTKEHTLQITHGQTASILDIDLPETKVEPQIGGHHDSGLRLSMEGGGGTLGALLRLRTRAVGDSIEHTSQVRSEILKKFNYGLWAPWWQTLKEPCRTSRLDKVVNSDAFAFLSMLVILSDAMITMIKVNQGMANLTDTPDGDKVPLYFSCFYVVELAMKIYSHKLFFFCNHDWAWNIFDTVLVLAVTTSEIISAFARQKDISMGFIRSIRLLKASKVIRVLHMFRYFDELRKMLRCLVNSALNFVWSAVILGFILLIFSMLFVQLMTTALSDPSNNILSKDRIGIQAAFPSVQGAMLTLLMSTTGGDDWSQYYKLLKNGGWASTALFILYILLFTMAIFNVVTALFVDSALKVAQSDLEAVARERQHENLDVAVDLSDLCIRIDTEHRGIITLRSFITAMKDADLKSRFELKGVDIRDAKLFFNVLSVITGSEEIDIPNFVTGCMRMRGQASSTDLLTLMCEVQLMNRSHRYCMQRILGMLDSMQTSICHIHRAANGRKLHSATPVVDTRGQLE